MKNILLFLVSLFSIGSLVFGQSNKTVSFTIPSSGVITAGQPQGYFRIQKDNKVTVQVVCTFTDLVTARSGSGLYQVQFDGINWLPLSTPDISFSKASANDQNRKTASVQLSSAVAQKTPTVGSRHVVDVVGYPVTNTEIIALDGVFSDSTSNVPVLNIGLVSRFEDATVSSFAVRVSSVGGFAQPTVLYLYDGSVILDTVSVTDGMAHFDNVNLLIPKGTLHYLSIRADIVLATVFTTQMKFKVDSDDMVLASKGTRATGVADSGELAVRSIGVISTVLSASIEKTTVTFPSGNTRDTVTARYSISLQPKGGDVIIPKQYDGHTFRFVLYKNGLAVE